ncbi:MAG: BrnT family toxin [Candidatus Hydrogenedentes bacterium]|nr:BrnT family toxin [Candidatus Hydrogenedentota bacterium]
MPFDWDGGKARANLLKHGVSFAEATTVFRDSFAIEGADPVHSIGEYRFITIGVSHTGRLLTVCYTEADNRVRIISARNATKSERKIYEEG